MMSFACKVTYWYYTKVQKTLYSCSDRSRVAVIDQGVCESVSQFTE